MVWQYVIPAAATLIAGYLGKKGQDDANQANVGLNQDNRSWMTEMSNTSYQRAVADMSAAGLNPMLAYSQGGASTPGNSAPIVQNSLGAGMSSAMQAMQTAQGLQQIKQSEAQTEQIQALAELQRSQTMSKDLNTAKLLADTAASDERAKLTASERLTEGRRYHLVQNQADASRATLAGLLADSRSKERTLEEMDKGGFKADVDRRKADAKLAELEIPKSKSEAQFYDSAIGQLNPWLRNIFETFKLIRGSTSRYIPRR